MRYIIKAEVEADSPEQALQQAEWVNVRVDPVEPEALCPICEDTLEYCPAR